MPDVGTELDEADAILGVNALYLSLLRRLGFSRNFCAISARLFFFFLN